MTYRNVIRFVFTPAIYEYVLDIVSKLNDSCAGFDMKPIWVYKIIFFSNLGHVMTGTFPTKFKIAKVITLHKNGCLKTVSNLRPILCSLGKILEKIVHHKFYDYFDFYYLFSKKHFGLGKVQEQKIVSILVLTLSLGALVLTSTPLEYFQIYLKRLIRLIDKIVCISSVTTR